MAELTERDTLKQRADLMGKTYKGNISTDDLRELVNSELKPVADAKLTEVQKRIKMRKDASALHRVIVVPNDPDKRELPGEMIDAGNAFVSDQRVYVPYRNTNGWHVPKIVLNYLQERECQIFVNKQVNGRTYRIAETIPAYNVTILPPLTQGELDDLALVQTSTGRLEND